MRLYVHFVFVFLYLQVVFTNCLPEDLYDANRNINFKTNTSKSAEPNFNLTCHSNRCLRKCCKATEIFNWSDSTCLPAHDELKNANWSAEYSKFEVIYDSACPIRSISLEVDEYKLFSNGSIDYINYGIINFHEYCVDYLPEMNAIRPVVCTETFENGLQKIFSLQHYLNLGGSIITNLFLIITLGLYSVAPELREHLHDSCVICHIFSLIIGFISLLGIQFLNTEDPLCVFTGESKFYVLKVLIFGCKNRFGFHRKP